MKVNSLIVNVTSPNPEALTAFYRDKVQLEPQEGMGGGAFQAGGGATFIIDGHSEITSSAREPKRVLIDFFVDDIASEHARLEAAGVKSLRKMGKEYWGGVVSTFEDPDGNYFQLMEFKPEEAQAH
jgi:predicted enzyme related to lactoylglutathione lyase